MILRCKSPPRYIKAQSISLSTVLRRWLHGAHRRLSWLTASAERMDRFWSGQSGTRSTMCPQKWQPCCLRWLYHYSVSNETKGKLRHCDRGCRTCMCSTAHCYIYSDPQIGTSLVVRDDCKILINFNKNTNPMVLHIDDGAFAACPGRPHRAR